MSKFFKQFLAGCMAILLVFSFASVNMTVSAAESSESTGSSEITVSDIDGLLEAFEGGYTEIYLESTNSYSIPVGFIIPEGTHLIGDGQVIFELGENLTYSQAGIYICYTNVILENITMQNDSSAEKPVLKIDASNVTLINCNIISNNKQSAVVIHGSTGIEISGCSIEKAYEKTSLLDSDTYPAVQVNAGSSVTFENTVITVKETNQAHITFAYDADSNTDYTEESSIIIDETVSFEGGYSGAAAIYSEAPSDVDRYDQVIVITEEYPEGIVLDRQEENSILGVTTEDTGWYCFNAEADDFALLWGLISGEGYVYTNIAITDPTDFIQSIIFGK